MRCETEQSFNGMSCVRNIRTTNYQNLIIGFQVTVDNVRNAFWDTAYNYFLAFLIFILTKNEIVAWTFSFRLLLAAIVKLALRLACY